MNLPLPGCCFYFSSLRLFLIALRLPLKPGKQWKSVASTGRLKANCIANISTKRTILLAASINMIIINNNNNFIIIRIIIIINYNIIIFIIFFVFIPPFSITTMPSSPPLSFRRGTTLSRKTPHGDLSVVTWKHPQIPATKALRNFQKNMGNVSFLQFLHIYIWYIYIWYIYIYF